MNLKLKLKKGLFSKMVATYVAIIALSFIFIATFLSIWFESYYFSQRRMQLEKESNLIKSYAIDYIKYGKMYTSEERDKALNFFGSYTLSDIWLVDRYGIVYSVSNEKFNSIKGTQKFTKA